MISQKSIGVITCDIVNSSLLLKEELDIFKKNIGQMFNENLVVYPRFYRGDSFQIASPPINALENALKIRLAMKSINDKNDVRVSVGIGSYKTLEENILLSTGKAFEISGKNLDKLKERKLNLLVQCEDQRFNEELETYCVFADALIKPVTKKQAGIMMYRIDGKGQREISDCLNVSQPSVSKSLKTANWLTIEHFIKRYKNLMKTT